VKKFEKEEMTTLVKVTNNLQQEGFTENFVPRKNGIEAPSKKRVYKPHEVQIDSFYRFEGESDPADNAIVYAIETFDGVKGLLVDAYGTYANHHVADFLTEVQRIEKSAHVHDPTNFLFRFFRWLFPPHHIKESKPAS